MTPRVIGLLNDNLKWSGDCCLMLLGVIAGSLRGDHGLAGNRRVVGLV